MTLPTAKADLLAGKKGLIVGVANDQSIAWGCARAFRALGADVALTYLNDKARRFVEPLAQEVEAPIFLPLDVLTPGQTRRSSRPSPTSGDVSTILSIPSPSRPATRWRGG